jgi:histone H3/H4
MSAADTFRHSALRVSVAQMVEQVGFEHCATEALELLTEVVADYLRTMCAASGDAARRAGRAKVNLNDIKTGFDAVDLDAETVLGHVEESDELGYLIEDLPYFPKPAAKASKRRDAAAATQSWPTASFAPSSSPSLSAPSRSPSVHPGPPTCAALYFSTPPTNAGFARVVQNTHFRADEEGPCLCARAASPRGAQNLRYAGCTRRE